MLGQDGSLCSLSHFFLWSSFSFTLISNLRNLFPWSADWKGIVKGFHGVHHDIAIERKPIVMQFQYSSPEVLTALRNHRSTRMNGLVINHQCFLWFAFMLKTTITHLSFCFCSPTSPSSLLKMKQISWNWLVLCHKALFAFSFSVEFTHARSWRWGHGELEYVSHGDTEAAGEAHFHPGKLLCLRLLIYLNKKKNHNIMGVIVF